MFIFPTISQPRTLSADIPAAGRGLFTKYHLFTHRLEEPVAVSLVFAPAGEVARYWTRCDVTFIWMILIQKKCQALYESSPPSPPGLPHDTVMACVRPLKEKIDDLTFSSPEAAFILVVGILCTLRYPPDPEVFGLDWSETRGSWGRYWPMSPVAFSLFRVLCFVTGRV